jgi:hypothetical protein
MMLGNIIVFCLDQTSSLSCTDAVDPACCIIFYTQPLMEELWKGSNECVFGLANASDNVAGTQRLCRKKCAGMSFCGLLQKRWSSARGKEF